MSSGCADLANVNINPAEWNSRPKFAASCKFVYMVFVENNQVILRCSPDGGQSFSGRKVLFPVAGAVDFLTINAREDVAVIGLLQQTPGGVEILAVTGKLVEPHTPNEAVADFDFQQCSPGSIAGKTFQDIVDAYIRINDDFTSEDFVFFRTGAGGGSSVHTGHHPHP